MPKTKHSPHVAHIPAGPERRFHQKHALAGWLHKQTGEPRWECALFAQKMFADLDRINKGILLPYGSGFGFFGSGETYACAVVEPQEGCVLVQMRRDNPDYNINA